MDPEEFMIAVSDLIDRLEEAGDRDRYPEKTEEDLRRLKNILDNVEATGRVKKGQAKLVDEISERTASWLH